MQLNPGHLYDVIMDFMDDKRLPMGVQVRFTFHMAVKMQCCASDGTAAQKGMREIPCCSTGPNLALTHSMY